MGKKLILLLVPVALLACQAVPHAQPISPASAEARRIGAALARWPAADEARRPFRAVMHIGGATMEAHGVLDYAGPRDFRMTARTKTGELLFDGRVNWAGVTVMGQGASLDRAAIESLLADVARAFELPGTLEGLAAGKSEVMLERTLADTNRYTWIFDRAGGQLRRTEVSLGLLDTLRVGYESYSARGWPQELRLERGARRYDAAFSFPEEAVVRGLGEGSKERRK